MEDKNRSGRVASDSSRGMVHISGFSYTYSCGTCDRRKVGYSGICSNEMDLLFGNLAMGHVQGGQLHLGGFPQCEALSGETGIRQGFLPGNYNIYKHRRFVLLNITKGHCTNKRAWERLTKPVTATSITLTWPS